MAVTLALAPFSIYAASAAGVLVGVGVVLPYFVRITEATFSVNFSSIPWESIDRITFTESARASGGLPVKFTISYTTKDGQPAFQHLNGWFYRGTSLYRFLLDASGYDARVRSRSPVAVSV